MHTYLCKHAEGGVEDYVLSAIERGLKEICFTEHMPFEDGFDPEHRMDPSEMDFYINEIERCRQKYREITILTGIEADYMEGYEEYLEGFISRYDFDLVIMSVHYVQKWEGRSWVFSYEYTKDTLEEQYREYFNEMIRGIQTGLFDIVGHFDLVKRVRNPVLRTNYDDVMRALNAIKEADMALELNASGLRKFINETYPSMKILGMAVEMGIPVSISSDAHKPEHVGYSFDELFNQLFNFPGLQLVEYRQRRRTLHPFGQPVFND